MRVTWRDVPDEVRHALEPLLARWEPVAPRWLEILTVGFDSDEEDASLSTLTRPEYRLMTLYVHPAWLTGDADKRSSDVLHELLHAPLEMSRDVFHNLLHAQVDDTEPIYGWVKEEYRKALESAVCDYEHGIQRLLATLTE